jgi:hypothetical protein
LERLKTDRLASFYGDLSALFQHNNTAILQKPKILALQTSAKQTQKSRFSKPFEVTNAEPVPNQQLNL